MDYLHKVIYKLMHQKGQFPFYNAKFDPYTGLVPFFFYIEDSGCQKSSLETVIGGLQNKSRNPQP